MIRCEDLSQWNYQHFNIYEAASRLKQLNKRLFVCDKGRKNETLSWFRSYIYGKEIMKTPTILLYMCVLQIQESLILHFSQIFKPANVQNSSDLEWIWAESRESEHEADIKT